MFIKNIGSTTVQDLEVKKIVYWDVWASIVGYSNYWGMDNIRKPNMNLAVAFVNSSMPESGPIPMGFASREKHTDYDLYWDKYESRGIYGPIKFSLSYKGKSSWLEDGCLVYQ